MLKSEVTTLLAYVQSLDPRREVDDLAVEAWSRQLEEVDLADALKRVDVFYLVDRGRPLLPSDVRPKRDPNAWMNRSPSGNSEAYELARQRGMAP